MRNACPTAWCICNMTQHVRCLRSGQPHKSRETGLELQQANTLGRCHMNQSSRFIIQLFTGTCAQAVRRPFFLLSSICTSHATSSGVPQRMRTNKCLWDFAGHSPLKFLSENPVVGGRLAKTDVLFGAFPSCQALGLPLAHVFYHWWARDVHEGPTKPQIMPRILLLVGP